MAIVGFWLNVVDFGCVDCKPYLTINNRIKVGLTTNISVGPNPITHLLALLCNYKWLDSGTVRFRDQTCNISDLCQAKSPYPSPPPSLTELSTESTKIPFK